MEERLRRGLRLLISLGTLVGFLWLLIHFLLPWGAPFLLAFALAGLMEPAVRWLASHGWPRGAAAGLGTLTLTALLLRGLAALIGWLGSLGAELADEVPALVRALGNWLQELEAWAERAVRYAPEGSTGLLNAVLESASQALSGIPGSLSRAALEGMTGLAQAGPDLLLFAATAGIGTYFLSAGFPRVLRFLGAQLPERTREKLRELWQDLRLSFGGFLRAQLILMAMTFFELLLAFLLLGVRGAAGLAAVTALVDAMPVFGTGTVLLPWALAAALLGQSGLGLGLVITWLVVNLMRSCVQAKLLGDQIGLDPLASLLAIYVGWRAMGVWGMLLFPLLLVTLDQLNEKGLLRLWKSEGKGA